jgi:hypothetical protein
VVLMRPITIEDRFAAGEPYTAILGRQAEQVGLLLLILIVIGAAADTGRCRARHGLGRRNLSEP